MSGRPLFADGGADGDTGGLLARARAGDQQAFEKLFLKSRTRLLLFIRSQASPAVLRAETEEEILVETFGDAFLGLHRFNSKGKGSFHAWLIRIAECKMADLRKKLSRGVRRREERLSTDGPAAQAQARTRGPATKARHKEGFDRLCRALEALPETQRNLIQMYKRDSLTLDEIHLRTGVPRSTVHDQIRAALAALEQAYRRLFGRDQYK